MKCPYCNYVSFDYLESCRKCSKDLTAHKSQFGLDFLQPMDIGLLTYVEKITSTAPQMAGESAVAEIETDDFALADEDLGGGIFGEERTPIESVGLIEHTDKDIGLNLDEQLGGPSEFELTLGGPEEAAGIEMGGGELELTLGEESVAAPFAEEGGIEFSFDEETPPPPLPHEAPSVAFAGEVESLADSGFALEIGEDLASTLSSAVAETPVEAEEESSLDELDLSGIELGEDFAVSAFEVEKEESKAPETGEIELGEDIDLSSFGEEIKAADETAGSIDFDADLSLEDFDIETPEPEPQAPETGEIELGESLDLSSIGEEVEAADETAGSIDFDADLSLEDFDIETPEAEPQAPETATLEPAESFDLEFAGEELGFGESDVDLSSAVEGDEGVTFNTLDFDIPAEEPEPGVEEEEEISFDHITESVDLSSLGIKPDTAIEEVAAVEKQEEEDSFDIVGDLDISDFSFDEPENAESTTVEDTSSQIIIDDSEVADEISLSEDLALSMDVEEIPDIVIDEELTAKKPAPEVEDFPDVDLSLNDNDIFSGLNDSEIDFGDFDFNIDEDDKGKKP